MLELVNKVRELGVDVPYSQDDDVPWEAQGVIKDLAFQLKQKQDEVAHLQWKIKAFNRTHRVQKREESPDRDQHPTKKREPSKGDESSYEPSPINEVKSFDLPQFLKCLPPIEGSRLVDPPHGPGRTAPYHQPQAI
jgi:hypothetical protein